MKHLPGSPRAEFDEGELRSRPTSRFIDQVFKKSIQVFKFQGLAQAQTSQILGCTDGCHPTVARDSTATIIGDPAPGSVLRVVRTGTLYGMNAYYQPAPCRLGALGHACSDRLVALARPFLDNCRAV